MVGPPEGPGHRWGTENIGAVAHQRPSATAQLRLRTKFSNDFTVVHDDDDQNPVLLYMRQRV